MVCISIKLPEYLLVLNWIKQIQRVYIYIYEESYLASGAIIFTHDYSRGLHKDTHIGKRCFIGANAIIMCGITIGDK